MDDLYRFILSRFEISVVIFTELKMCDFISPFLDSEWLFLKGKKIGIKSARTNRQATKTLFLVSMKNFEIKNRIELAIMDSVKDNHVALEKDINMPNAKTNDIKMPSENLVL
jgi:hypothetical protein